MFFSCSHTTASCAKTHYREAGLVLLFVFLFQTVLTFLSHSVTVAGDTLHLGSDVVGTLGTWLVLFLVLRTRISESTAVVFVLANVLLLIGGGVVIASESYTRLSLGILPDRGYMLFAGVIGLAGNILAVALLKQAKSFPTHTLHENHHVNLVHLRSDVWLSVVVIISALGSFVLGTRVDAWLGLLVALYVINEGIGHGYFILTGKRWAFHFHRHTKHEHHHH